MSKRPEDDAEEENTPPVRRRKSGGEEDEGGAAPKSSVLKLIVIYVARGFAPVVAVVALAVAVVAVVGNRSSQAQLARDAVGIKALDSSLVAARAELARLNAAMAQEKAAQEAERKQQGEQEQKIIASVTRLQVKLKISPTLEEQLMPPVSAASAVSAVSAVTAAPAAAASAPAKVEKKLSPQAQAIKAAIDAFNK
ncbi:MAG: hypothetical protein GC139_06740 [Sideroxydans sp.]|nr:hypothetical protein [Sideroxydans sp.]